MYRKLFFIIGMLALLVPTGAILAQSNAGRQIDDTVPNDITLVNENKKALFANGSFIRQ